MTKGRKPTSKSGRPAVKAGPRPASKSARDAAGDATPGTGSIGRDGKLHIQPGSVRKPKTDSRPRPASRHRPEESALPEGEAAQAHGPATRGRSTGRSSSAGRSGGTSTGRRPNLPKQRGPQLDAPPSGTQFRDRDGKLHTFPESNLKRIAARILTERSKKWRYRPFGFPIFSASGSEQEMHFDFYVYDNMDSIFKLILLMPRESRDVWDRVGRFKQQYPMYSYELWTPDHLAKVMGPRGSLGW